MALWFGPRDAEIVEKEKGAPEGSMVLKSKIKGTVSEELFWIVAVIITVDPLWKGGDMGKPREFRKERERLKGYEEERTWQSVVFPKTLSLKKVNLQG